jgi:hypothetical protein
MTTQSTVLSKSPGGILRLMAAFEHFRAKGKSRGHAFAATKDSPLRSVTSSSFWIPTIC